MIIIQYVSSTFAPSCEQNEKQQTIIIIIIIIKNAFASYRGAGARDRILMINTYVEPPQNFRAESGRGRRTLDGNSRENRKQ